MKKPSFIVSLIALLPAVLSGANNVDISCLFDILPPQGYNDSIPLYIEIENDVTLHGLLMAFDIEVTGELAVHFNGTSQVRPDYADKLQWNLQYVGAVPYDTFLVSGYKMAGDEGISPGAMRKIIDVDIYVYECSFLGEMCISECETAGPGDSWLWTNSAGGEIIPDFNDGAGPVCFEAIFPPCGVNTFSVTPSGDQLSGNHCYGVQFQFQAEPGLPDDSITGFDLCEGAPPEAVIEDDGWFYFGPAVPGIYPVSIRAIGSCPTSEIYSFEVILTNKGLMYNACPSESIQQPCGEQVLSDLGLLTYDCDPIDEEIEIISSPRRLDPANMPECDEGVFTWMPEPGEEGSWIFGISGSDPYGETADCQLQVDVSAASFLCGDANNDDAINVSDAVYIIYYVFAGGDAPEPYLAGDTNCDSTVNVSDAVWIVNHVFIGGPAPCDC